MSVKDKPAALRNAVNVISQKENLTQDEVEEWVACILEILDLELAVREEQIVPRVVLPADPSSRPRIRY